MALLRSSSMMTRTLPTTTPPSSSWMSLLSPPSALMTSASQFSPLPTSNLLWLYARCLTVLLLLAPSVNGEMHINKCCGAKEQLRDYLDYCVPYEGPLVAPLTDKTTTVFSMTTEVTTTTEPFTATALPTTTMPPTTTEVPTTPPGEMILKEGLPYWIDPDLTVLETLNHLPLGAEAAWAGARATVGRRPCSFTDTQYVYTLRREMYQLLANGSLLLPMWRTDAHGSGRTAIQVAFPPDEWCMDRVGSGHFVFLACPCQRVTCLNRCCNRNKMYEAQKNRQKLNAACKKVDNATALMKDPVFYSGQEQLNDTEAGDGQSAEGGGGVVYTELFAHTIKCDDQIYGKYLLNAHSEEGKKGFWIQRNGSVIIENYNGGVAFERHHVCHVEVQTMNGSAIPDVFFCHKRSTESKPSQENVFYSLLFLLGAFFLLLTLVVHALVPELRRSAHAKALMCHCASLLVACVTLTVGHLHRRAVQPYCSISTFLVQFFFLSTFFWLNVMCFDLSWTFGAMRRRRMVSLGGDRSRRFLWYSLYAWGCPALITSITLIMEYAPFVPPDLPLLPNIGARRCWFDTKMATLVYYYGPVALLLLVNLALFVFTVVRIRHSRRGTSILRKGSANARTQGGASKGTTRAAAAAATPKATAALEPGSSEGGDGTTVAGGDEGTESEKVSATAAKTAAVKSPIKSVKKTSGDRQMLIVFTKLFCLMGVTWVTEIVSWLAGDDTFAFWYITDTVNLLRGVLIFLLFCWKPVALRPLKARLRTWAECCCPWALRLRASRKQPRMSISTLESSLSMPDLMDSTSTAVGPAAPGAVSAIGYKDDAL